MSERIIKVGIIGCGGIANGKHMPSLKKLNDVQMVAFCDIVPEKAEKAAKEYGTPDAKVYTDYKELLAAGVKIYEYEPGFIHSKNFVVDGHYASVGTVNMDYRSMFLHFENGVLLYDTPSVLEIRDDFLETQAKSLQVTYEQCLKVPLYRRMFRGVLRAFATLL